uniref:Uncharacterized protein n=1 Tax=Branchiostoma floridae TaxID=7739 RepID=C3XUV2_BRAFL|eukprot:XP_002612168.1 hypothetical protein BRAFLDRAFT_88907 [Branchiostoma floridae]
MSAWLCVILALGCVMSYGSIESEKTTTGPQFSSPLYRNQGALQTTSDLQTKTNEQTTTKPQFSSPLYRDRHTLQTPTTMKTKAKEPFESEQITTRPQLSSPLYRNQDALQTLSPFPLNKHD